MIKNKRLFLSLIYAFFIGLSLLMVYLKYSDLSLFINQKKSTNNNFEILQQHIKVLEQNVEKKDELIMILSNENKKIMEQIHNLKNIGTELTLCKRNYIKLHNEMNHLGCIGKHNEPLPIVKRTIEIQEKII